MPPALSKAIVFVKNASALSKGSPFSGGSFSGIAVFPIALERRQKATLSLLKQFGADLRSAPLRCPRPFSHIRCHAEDQFHRVANRPRRYTIGRTPLRERVYPKL